MTTPSRTNKDNSFSAFAVGVAVGVAASFLFGTEDGRALVKRVLDAIPDKYKNIPDPVRKIAVELTPHSEPHLTPVIPVQETAHHTTYDYLSSTRFSSHEAPPPPAPLVHPTRPEPFNPET